MQPSQKRRLLRRIPDARTIEKRLQDIREEASQLEILLRTAREIEAIAEARSTSCIGQQASNTEDCR